jgi:hypothetical protein
MGARQKLNQVYAMGCFVLAGIAGLLTGSGAVFVLVVIILLATCFASGEIRTAKRNW